MRSRKWRLILADHAGHVVAEDRLYRTATGWAHPMPVFCHQGHRFRPGRTTVGFRHCRALLDSTGGHRSYLCRECGDVVLVPEPTPACEHRDFDRRPAGTTPGPAASE